MKRYYRQNWITPIAQQTGNLGLAILIILVLIAAMGSAATFFPVFKHSSIEDAVVFIEVQSDSGEYSGSGTIISSDGNIVTNRHVIYPDGDNPNKITVWMYSGTPRKRAFTAEVKARDDVAKITDIKGLFHDWAVIKINSEKPLPYVKIGDSRTLKKGATVTVAGFPLGRVREMGTNGPSDKIDRGTITDLISDSQGGVICLVHSCNLARGHSGGPVCDESGALVGINTAGFRGDGTPLNDPEDNMAIPSHLLVDQIWSRYSQGGHSR